MTARPEPGKPSPTSAEAKAHSVDQFCRHYGIGKTTAYKLMARGELRARKIGRRTFIMDEDARALFEGAAAFQSEASGARAA